MGLADIDKAVRVREVITEIAKDTVKKIRPSDRIGKVFSVNLETQVAYVLFPGETVDNLVPVRFALDKIPTQLMSTTWASLQYNALGDIVRVAESQGSYYILDFISGIPEIDPKIYDLITTLSDAVDALTQRVEALENQ